MRDGQWDRSQSILFQIAHKKWREHLREAVSRTKIDELADCGRPLLSPLLPEVEPGTLADWLVTRQTSLFESFPWVEKTRVNARGVDMAYERSAPRIQNWDPRSQWPNSPTP